MSSRRIQTVRLEKDFLEKVTVVNGLWSFESEMFQIDPENGTPGFFVPLYCEEGTQISLAPGRAKLYLKDAGKNVDPSYFKDENHEMARKVVVLATDGEGIIEYSDIKKYQRGRRLVA